MSNVKCIVRDKNEHPIDSSFASFYQLVIGCVDVKEKKTRCLHVKKKSYKFCMPYKYRLESYNFLRVYFLIRKNQDFAECRLFARAQQQQNAELNVELKKMLN